MIAILSLCYLGCVLLAFKVIRIRVTAVSVAVAAVIGVLMLGGIVIGWKLAAPMTSQIVLRRHVLQITPDVREFVSRVYVEPDQMVRQGDPLFEILPDRFQNAVDQASAQLASAQAAVSRLEAAREAAVAASEQSIADAGAAKAQLDTALAVQATQAGAVARLQIAEAEQAYRAAEADNRLKEASIRQAEASLVAAEHSVTVAQAALNIAEFDLSRCTFVAPVDGQVVNWQIREQIPVARWRFASNGTLMDLSDTAIIAVYPQNLLKNVRADQAVEVVFKRRPGEIVAGTVESVAPYTGEGQMVASSTIPLASSVGSQGYLAVRIRLNDDELARSLPLGAAGSVAIYTDTAKPLHLISMIAIRMVDWMNYLPF